MFLGSWMSFWYCWYCTVVVTLKTNQAHLMMPRRPCWRCIARGHNWRMDIVSLMLDVDGVPFPSILHKSIVIVGWLGYATRLLRRHTLRISAGLSASKTLPLHLHLKKKRIMLTIYFLARRNLQLENVEIIVADISTFDMEASYDRVFSIEMFEVTITFLPPFQISSVMPRKSFQSIIVRRHRSTWRTTRNFLKRFQTGCTTIAFCLFIIFVIKHLLTILRYSLMLLGQLKLQVVNTDRAQLKFYTTE